MVKIVEKGCRDCSVVLDGSECAVVFEHTYDVCSALNMSDGDIIISVDSGKTAEDDGVMIVEAGGCAMLAHMRKTNTVYLTGKGKVRIHAGNEAVIPFKPIVKGGDVVEAHGNPVELSGLQEGVPFNSVTVSGKNLLKYPFANKTKTENGITFTDNGDGTITANGTATDNARFYTSLQLVLPTGEYTLSDGNNLAVSEGCYIQVYTFDAPYTTLATTFTKTSFVLNEPTALTVRIMVSNGNTVDNVVIKPQLELGTTHTAYEQPITSRELTININGTDYTITPDSNPYVIPNDIRQQDGLNVISVSEGELSVTGSLKNSTLKKVWNKLDELATAVIVSNGELE